MGSEKRYVGGLSDDLFVTSPDFGARRAALAMDLLSFCTECGCVVYSRHLHDQWHSAIEAAGKGGEVEPPPPADIGARQRTSVAGPGDTIIGTLLIARAELEHKPTTENLHAYSLAAAKAVADINALAESRPVMMPTREQVESAINGNMPGNGISRSIGVDKATDSIMALLAEAQGRKA